MGSHSEGISPYGCQDMIGNVWEWCADWYDSGYYKNSPKENPRGPDSGTRRVLRGGSWYVNLLSGLRCADRVNNVPDDWFFHGGFRCAQDLDYIFTSLRP
ncbi:MAG: hypothetical protein AUJ96_33055 [Armatimonadetes bacterium CG2_30_66_41]|nr:MAG: hypothetical protein AUJ96_33055 [Armatimonadetes bacterium CG2_30_66_41]